MLTVCLLFGSCYVTTFPVDVCLSVELPKGAVLEPPCEFTSGRRVRAEAVFGEQRLPYVTATVRGVRVDLDPTLLREGFE